MDKPRHIKPRGSEGPRSVYDPDAQDEGKLWFLPGPDGEEDARSDLPWPVAAREGSLEAAVWRGAERAQYQALIRAAEGAAGLAEKLVHAPGGMADRLALLTVSHVLKSEGVWLGPERVALYQAMRLATDDKARNLARASWGWRRLAGAVDPLEDLRGFLGRVSVGQAVPGDERPVGAEFDVVADDWAAQVAGLQGCHPLTRAAYAFACWRGLAITPWDELLEPTVAALCVGGSLGSVPLIAGARLDRHGLVPGAGGAEARLAGFYEAVEQSTLAAKMEVNRVMAWRSKAVGATADLSGRTPPALIDLLVARPVVSADLVADGTGCSKAAARRNLAAFAARGLVREITGHARYRYWSIAG